MSEEQDSFTLTRRAAIATAAFVPLTALTAAAQPPATALTAAQLKTLEAFVDRLVPQDELGPGAVECGAAAYIDRALAGALAGERETFLDGLSAVESFAHSSHAADFTDLSPEVRDALLADMENGAAPAFPNSRQFFARVRRLTLEGMFGDPSYGGNRNFAGWDLIRYPGPRLAVAPEDQKMGTPPKPYRKSAYGAGDANGR